MNEQGLDIFATTRWSLVSAATRDGGDRAGRALEALFARYHTPIYIYIRRRGYSPTNAEDLVQAFFLRVIEKDSFARDRRERGRLRAYLLIDLKGFLSDQAKWVSAEKPGSHQSTHLRLEVSRTEGERELQLLDPRDSPDLAFEKNWASSLLASVMEELEASYRRDGRGENFDTLKDFIPNGRDGISYKELAERCGKKESALRIAVARLRSRFRRLLDEHVRDTVCSDEEVDDEISHLRSLF